MEVKLRDISRSPRLRLITHSETLIILDITQTECYNCFIIIIFHGKKKWKSCNCFFTARKQHKACEVDMVTCDLECP